MVGRIVEIASDDRHVSLERGFLVVSQHGEEVARTPIDDIDALVSAAHGLSFSNNVLVALAERSCPVVLCGSNFRPAAIVWPLHGHHRAGARLSAQIRARTPVRNRLWQQVVRAKIWNQASVIGAAGGKAISLRRMVSKVRTGDRTNVEGQAARSYWRLLFGDTFRRDVDGDGPNALLNYGYAVLRAAVARHIAAAGLHPNVPLHHSNEGNTLRLADDLMEPFRPLTDLWVSRLIADGTTGVDRDAKRVLGLLPSRTVSVSGTTSTVATRMSALCRSLADVFEGDLHELELPMLTESDLRMSIRGDESKEKAEPPEG